MIKGTPTERLLPRWLVEDFFQMRDACFDFFPARGLLEAQNLEYLLTIKNFRGSTLIQRLTELANFGREGRQLSIGCRRDQRASGDFAHAI